jgi:hypothetical protein
MTYLSSVPKIEFTAAGLVIPQETDILTGVQADYNAAFGGNLNNALETPQGQLASSHTAVIADKNSEFAYIVNQVDPQYSDGRFQDAIARIYFLTRKPATSTSVAVTLIGAIGTVIPAGAFAQDTNGNTYACAGTVTIGLSGNVSATFNNVDTGAIPCAAGTLTQIYQAISGWDSITNPDAGVLGSDAETRADFEYRRQNSVFTNANGSLGAVYAAVFNLADVIDVYATQNTTNSAILVGATNYSLLPHSIYVAVEGGADNEIANAIWTKISIGCDFNGNTSVIISDTSYSSPQPSYTIKFNRPSLLPILFSINIVSSPSLPSDIIQQIKTAIINRFNGADGTARERIAGIVYASRYYSAIASLGDIAIISILIGTSTPTLSSINVGIDQMPTLSALNISVTLV